MEWLKERDGRANGAAGKGKAKSKGDVQGSLTRGAPQPATGSLTAFLRAQKRKLWCRHLQHVCGTKQIWEIMAFTGRFDADIFRQALRSSEQE